ncbi:MAG: hypothetical protein GXO74_01225, partial [Calditrichaeota bacterium]|nr:hypothetical protein [Calditrichota bacterium]
MKPLLLFIKTMNSPFIRQDELLLGKHFQIKPFLFRPGNAIRMAKSQVQMFFWLVKNIWRADVVFVWFADYHSLLPVIFSRIFGKKSVVMLGGMDAVKLPEVKQGVYLRPFRGLCAKLSV